AGGTARAAAFGTPRASSGRGRDASARPAGAIARGPRRSGGILIKYIGSKRLLVPQIVRAILARRPRTALDLFSGTSRVGHALKREGVRVHANDHNAYAYTLATCYVTSDAHRWREPATRLVAELDRLPGRAGWFTETYAVRSRYLPP